MVLRVFNTLTRRKEVFKPISENLVRMYTCGPTVYAVPHIGNYRSFLMADIIKRYLEHTGYRVKHVMNITDIDDKTIRDSAKEGLSLKEFTEKYTEEFFRGIDLLNIKRASEYPRATENMDEMVKITRSLVDKGYAYVSSGSVYFDISKFSGYGRLSKIDLSSIKVGARVDVDEYAKDSPQDFALMKASTEEEARRGVSYETEWGKVRPGWHIECSAISMKHLGETFDIHTGGVDLIFPHHDNEIVQSEAYTGKNFVNYWMHGEHLLVNGEKMAKSLGNIVTLDDTIRKFSAEAVRYMYLSTHYRKKLNYTERFAENASRNYERLKETFIKLNSSLKFANEEKTKRNEEFLRKLPKIKERFLKAMDDDFNTPLALRVFHELSRQINRYLEKNGNRESLKSALNLFMEFSEILGLLLREEELKLPKEVEELISRREEAREKRDWKTADEIRLKLRELGIQLEDTPKGVRWRKLRN